MYILLDKPAYSGYAANVCYNLAYAVKNIGSYVIVFVGIILIIVAIMQIVKGLIMYGKNAWFMTILTLSFGGFLTIDGLVTVMGNLSRVGKDTLEYIGDGMVTTTANPITAAADPSQATFGADAARNAVGIMSDTFFVPFAQAASLIVGVILLIMAIVQIATFFRSAGKAKVSIVKVAAMAALGSVLFAATPSDPGAGWNWIVNKAVGATRDTIVGAAEGNYNSAASMSALFLDITL